MSTVGRSINDGRMRACDDCWRAIWMLGSHLELLRWIQLRNRCIDPRFTDCVERLGLHKGSGRSNICADRGAELASKSGSEEDCEARVV